MSSCSRFVCRGASLLLVLLGSLVVADAPSGGWSRAESELRQAVRSKAWGEARSVVGRLAATGEPKGVRLICKYALGGEDRRLYSVAAGHLAKLEAPELRREVYEEISSSRNFRTRIILLAVVRRWPDDPLAMAALHGRLSDRQKPVVFAALRWIRQINRPDLSLEPLADELGRRERESRGRVYFDLRSTLQKLTGHELELAADWKNYIEGRRSGIPSPPRPREGGRTTLYKRPSFFSLSVDSDRVVFLIDVSQSMLEEDPVEQGETGVRKDRFVGDGATIVRLPPADGGAADGAATVRKRTRLSAVQEELTRTVRGLPESTRFTIIWFNHQNGFLDGSPVLVPATPSNKQRAVRWVESFRATGATRTDLALLQAFGVGDADTFCLLTDGAPKNAKNEKISPEYVFSVVKEQNRFRKCRIHTIGFYHAGTSMRRFVLDLARQNEGKCVLLR